MAMNRETKRMLQRQGALTDDGSPKASRRPVPSANAPKEPRTKPRQFVKEVNAELRKVAWPTRQETINYSVIVFFTLIVLTALIAGLDWVFSKGILWLVSK
ncbi:MAG: preprotein translocase, SecE subunit [Acidimicrobiales bacterium]|nr:preprotein translocase, SecE subunit [Acidimicrobiales bacterium]